MTAPDETRLPPRPPDHLIERVSPKLGEAITAEDRTAFDRSGQQSARELQTFLGSIGRTLDSFTRILDFGCGCGRVTRWMSDVARRSELHGCDIDKLAIEWDQEHLPFARFLVNAPEPPLPYPDSHFDLVLNHSVFTHIDERYQDLWLAELQRVTRPGGILVLSVHGERAFGMTEEQTRAAGEDTSRWRDILEHDGILFVADDGYVGGVFPDYYHSTFHAPWYIFQHWSRWFDVRAYLPHADLGHQDIVVLEHVSEQRYPATRARPSGTPAPSPANLPVTTPLRQHFRRALRAGARGVAQRLLDGSPESSVAETPPQGSTPDQAEASRIPTVVHAILEDHGRRLRRLEEQALTNPRAPQMERTAPGSDDAEDSS